MSELPQHPGASSASGFFGHTPETLGALFAEWGQPSYRVKQMFEWVYLHGVDSFDNMTNLPKALRGKLESELPLYQSKMVGRQVSRDGAIKMLLGWPDGATSECVLIPDDERQTGCVSTQVGCPVRCTFCASGVTGLERQLSAGQIVEQAMRIRGETGEHDRLSNIVFMGLGEPLANYDATVHAVRTINADWGLGIGARKITVSTVGLPTMIRRLAGEGLQITLAISLHAPTDALRAELIPWAERVSIDELVDAANDYFGQTGREITLEYLLLGRVNDATEHARQLAKVAKRMRSNVNLLSFNTVEGLPYDRPSDESADRFLATLRSCGVNAHLRRSRGLDIDAACGQLRRRENQSGSVAT